jgi:hypothetical protein
VKENGKKVMTELVAFLTTVSATITFGALAYHRIAFHSDWVTGMLSGTVAIAFGILCLAMIGINASELFHKLHKPSTRPNLEP